MGKPRCVKLEQPNTQERMTQHLVTNKLKNICANVYRNDAGVPGLTKKLSGWSIGTERMAEEET